MALELALSIALSTEITMQWYWLILNNLARATWLKASIQALRAKLTGLNQLCRNILVLFVTSKSPLSGHHLDRLANSMTPAKKRKNLNHVLYGICVNFNQFDSVLSYMFKVAENSGHKQ